MEMEVERYHRYTKPRSWYAIFALVMAAGVLYAILKTDYVQIFFYAVITVGLAVYIMRDPGKTTLSLDQDSVILGRMRTPLSDYKGYFVVQDAEVDFVYLLSKGRIKPPLKLHISPDKIDEFTELLSKSLDYLENEKEPLIDTYLRVLRF
jgi:hypothetical protein